MEGELGATCAAAAMVTALLFLGVASDRPEDTARHAAEPLNAHTRTSTASLSYEEK